MKRTIFAVVAVALFLGGGRGSASAGLLLDQSNVVDTSSVANYYNFEVSQVTQVSPPAVFQNQEVQTFQVGQTGRLNQIDVEVWRFAPPGPVATGPLTLQLWTFSGSQLVSQVGGDYSVPVTSVSTLSPGGSFVTFDLGTGPAVVAGEKLAILLKSTEESVSPYQWQATRINSYANGAGFSTASYQTPSISSLGGPDFGFKTYVDTTGSSQSDPVLPNSVNGSGDFVFTNVPTGSWFDPPSAYGFDYIMTGGSLFTKIDDFPTGFGPVTVSSGGQVLGSFSPGQSFTFAGSGVSEFSVTGLNPLVNPADTSAYPLKLEFNTDTASFEMDPLSATSTPEPSTLVLTSIVFGIFGTARLRKRLKRTALPV